METQIYIGISLSSCSSAIWKISASFKKCKYELKLKTKTRVTINKLDKNIKDKEEQKIATFSFYLNELDRLDWEGCLFIGTD